MKNTPFEGNVQNMLFEVLAAVVIKRTTIGDITPCSPLKDKRRFEGISVEFHRTAWRYISANVQNGCEARATECEVQTLRCVCLPT